MTEIVRACCHYVCIRNDVILCHCSKNYLHFCGGMCVCVCVSLSLDCPTIRQKKKKKQKTAHWELSKIFIERWDPEIFMLSSCSRREISRGLFDLVRKLEYSYIHSNLKEALNQSLNLSLLAHISVSDKGKLLLWCKFGQCKF